MTAAQGGPPMSPPAWLPFRPALFLLLQLAVLAVAWAVLGRGAACRSGALLRLPPLLQPWGGAAPAPAPSPAATHTSNVSEWAAAPDQLDFLAPQSRCLLDRRGVVSVHRHGRPAGLPTLPFLFETASMPGKQEACAHCPPDKFQPVPYCCGVCQFASRKCDDFWPGQNRGGPALAHLLGTGLRLQDLSPCELFGRIRGRTLWVMGDSQAWNLYYALECFMREFAPTLARAPPFLPQEAADKLITVVHPVPYPPLCLPLVLGTRVCVVRVDAVKDMRELVLPTLQNATASFSRDIIVYNFGLHYPKPGFHGEPVGASMLWGALASLGALRQQQRGALPQMVWMDTPPQHFDTPDGSYPGGQGPFRCAPLRAYFGGNATLRAGGPYNAPLAPLIPRIADAHLRTWDDTVALWGTHWKDECTHWCHPTAYQLWIFLLNDVLRQHAMGNPVWVPERY